MGQAGEACFFEIVGGDMDVMFILWCVGMIFGIGRMCSGASSSENGGSNGGISHHDSFDHNDDNPMTGLPMMGATDIGGNFYGTFSDD